MKFRFSKGNLKWMDFMIFPSNQKYYDSTKRIFLCPNPGRRHLFWFSFLSWGKTTTSGSLYYGKADREWNLNVSSLVSRSEALNVRVGRVNTGRKDKPTAKAGVFPRKLLSCLLMNTQKITSPDTKSCISDMKAKEQNYLLYEVIYFMMINTPNV